ncbi:NAD(P)-dependent glycerol-3-phosphate dehydrogenase [candidate division WOR-3 bacterium]|nr:NAD(P)-dependent glycerol-3-phosphate dehydrogenase [candidate division WOR-3 bacterium]
MEKTRVKVFGAGNWGTTLALHLERLGAHVYLFEPLEERRRALREERENKLFLPGFKLGDSVEIIDSTVDEGMDADLVFIVVPSKYFDSTLENLSPLKDSGADFVNFTKGLGENGSFLLSDAMKKYFPEDKIAVVSGPTIAAEIAAGLPASCVAASSNPELALRIQKTLSSKRLRVYTSDDVKGVELGGALKNIIALAAGILDGMCLGTNAKAALMTRGQYEIEKLGTALGAKKETFSGLSGFGDLITTCFSDFSRNRTMGEKLGRGTKLTDIQSEMLMVAEGERTARIAERISKEKGIEMPITSAVVGILDGKFTPAEAVERLMERDLKPEIPN